MIWLGRQGTLTSLKQVIFNAALFLIAPTVQILSFAAWRSLGYTVPEDDIRKETRQEEDHRMGSLKFLMESLIIGIIYWKSRHCLSTGTNVSKRVTSELALHRDVVGVARLTADVWRLSQREIPIFHLLVAVRSLDAPVLRLSTPAP